LISSIQKNMLLVKVEFNIDAIIGRNNLTINGCSSSKRGSNSKGDFTINFLLKIILPVVLGQHVVDTSYSIFILESQVSERYWRIHHGGGGFINFDRISHELNKVELFRDRSLRNYRFCSINQELICS